MDIKQLRESLRQGIGVGSSDAMPEKARPPAMEALDDLAFSKAKIEEASKAWEEAPKVEGRETRPDGSVVFSIHKLHFQEGKSDKVYNVRVLGATKGEVDFIVEAEWGKRIGHKTVSPKSTHTTLGEAERAADKLVAEKVAKGYRRAP